MSKQELKAKPKAKTKMEFWTPTEKENTKTQYGCEILMTNVTFKEAMTNNAPNDAQVVSYMADGELRYDLTRGSRTSLFDMYYDKFKGDLKAINFGNGKISAKLWGYQSKNTKGKKKK